MGTQILLLDDDEETQKLVCTTLAERGYTVSVARRISEARTLLGRTRFDLMVIDGLLPDGSGVDFIATCRTQLDDLPAIVFISSFFRGIDHYRRLTRELGVSQVISKPFSPDELLVQIEAILAAPDAPSSTEGEAQVDALLQEKLAALREGYGAALPEKVHAVAEAVANAQITGNLDALEAARDLVHKIHGTAGSYGFPELGVAAGRLEQILQRGLQDRQPTAVSWGEASDLVAELRRLQRASQPQEQQEQPAEASPDPEHPSATVLVVDDDEDFLNHVTHLGEQAMVRVVVARTVEEAVERARTHHLDAAMIDVTLADYERAEDVAAALREIERQRSLPLAFVSADTGLENRISAVDAGASLFLDKPLAREAFIEAVNQLCVDRQRRPRILIVDDQSNCTALSTLLLDHGYEPHALSDPTKIVEAIEQVRPDLLLLDLVMPRLSGFDICKMVRANPSWQMPLIVTTADSTPQVRVASYAAGADDYLEKPIIEEELLVRIQLRLEQARQSRERSERDPLTGLLTRREPEYAIH